MNSQIFLQLAQLGAILVGFLGIAVSLRSHRRQMYAEMYIEFSTKFQNLLRTLPMEIWAEPRREADPLPARREELTKACMQCFHIIADLYHLHQGGYIAPELWHPWQRGIRRAMQRPLVRREWLALEWNFEHDPELCRYMHRLATPGAESLKQKRPRAGARPFSLFR